MEEGVLDCQSEKIVDHIQHDKLSDLSPDFGFVSSADVQEQGIEHFARVVASKNAFEAAGNRVEGGVHDVGVPHRCLESEPEQGAYFLGGQAPFEEIRSLLRLTFEATMGHT